MMKQAKTGSGSMKLSIKERIGYVCGAYGMQITTNTIQTYLLLFQTTCMGLGNKAAGMMFLLGRFVDAVTDIAMATVADRTRTRWGSYRPYLLFGAIPLGIIFALNFWFPSFLNTETSKLVWSYLMYFLSGSLMATVCGVPFGAMASVMTTDRVERAKLAASRTIGEQAASLVLSGAVLSIVLHYGDQSTVTGWRVMALLFGGMAIVAWLICFFTTRERVEVVPQGQDPTPLKERLAVFKHNTPLYGMMGIMLFTFFSTVFMAVSFNYYCIYVLQQPQWTAGLATVGAAISIVVALLVPKLLGRFEKRNLLALGAAIILAALVFLFFAESYAAVLTYQLIKGCGLAFILSNIWSCIPDAADYGEWRNGVAAPGLVYSVMMFVLKCTTGVGSYAVAFILSLVGFDGLLEVQSASTIAGLRSAIIVGPIILMGLLVVCSFLLKAIDREKITAIAAELDGRRTGQAN